MQYSRNKILKIGLLVILLVIITTSANSQSVKADSIRFAIGSKLNLTLMLPISGNETIIWPKINDTITKSIEVLAKSKIDTIVDPNSGSKVMQQVISITSFDTGFIAVPPFTFTKGGQAVLTEPLLLEVYKIKVDPAADIKDIKPIMNAPLTLAEILPWLIGIMLLGAALYGIFYFIKRRKTKPVVDKPEGKFKIPAWEIALSKLEALNREQIWQKGDIKEYYTRLTDILREYFEVRYNVNASEMTSTEIAAAMDHHIKHEEAMKSLRNVLYLADLAKFAKAQPGAFENEQSINYGIEIINYTKPSTSELTTTNSSKSA